MTGLIRKALTFAAGLTVVATVTSVGYSDPRHSTAEPVIVGNATGQPLAASGNSAHHVGLKAVVDTDGRKKVEMEYHNGAVVQVFRGRGPHENHDPIIVRIDDQDTVIWESTDDKFVVSLKDANPFYRPFPAESIQGRDGIHRVSSGPARYDEIGKQRHIHFLVRFTGLHANSEELDPHMATFP